jgi:hypothetical protein
VTPDIYVPIPQVPDVTVQWLANNMYWGVRTSGDPSALRDAFRRALRDVDPDVPASAMKTMDEALEAALAPRRLNLQLVGAFGVMALALAAAGVYAVTSFGVAMRRREMAIRAALGARVEEIFVWWWTPSSHLRRAVSRLGGCLAAGPALRLLFGGPVRRRPEPPVVGATLLAANLVASMTAALPIRRIDPLDALRIE